MAKKYTFGILASFALFAHVTSLGDISSDTAAGAGDFGSGIRQTDASELNTLSVKGGMVVTEPKQEAVGALGIDEAAGIDRFSLQPIENESNKVDVDEFVNVLASPPPLEESFVNGGRDDRADADADGQGNADGWWKRKMMLMTEPSSIGIFIVIGCAAVWVRRKLIL